jgi:4-hydroxythreonine-4-phosphate dehydrogenase
VTPGCPAGVGPEVVAAALARAVFDDESIACTFLGPAELLSWAAAIVGVRAEVLPGEPVRVRLAANGRERVLEVEEHAPLQVREGPYGPVDEAALRFQREALLAAVEGAREGRFHAIVTGPVRKPALQDVRGHAFPGQTELVHHFLGADEDEPLMCFTGGPFVLGLATVHLPLREVSDALTRERLRLCLRRLADATRRVLGVDAPRLAVLGLNPHAGEGGLLGHEEQDVIRPALEEARAQGFLVEGPLPADGFFASLRHRAPGAVPQGVLAMHHDQGLGPYKLLAEGRGVNLTWGLKVPRTSPDHGTADDLAGMGVADASSTKAALELAARLVDGHG